MGIRRTLRACAVALAFSVVSSHAADTRPPATLEACLPPDTPIFVRWIDPARLADDFDRSALKTVTTHMEVEDFLLDVAAKRDHFLESLAEDAGVPAGVVEALAGGQVSMAFLPGGPGRFCIAVAPAAPLDREALFGVVAAVARTRISRDIPRSDETMEGVRVLALGTPAKNWFLALDGLLVFTTDKSVAEEIARRHAKKAPRSLARNPVFLRVQRNARATEGAGFLYLAPAPVIALLRSVGSEETVELLNALGLDAVQGVGVSNGFSGEGMYHQIYLHAPGKRSGVLEMLSLRGGAVDGAASAPAETTTLVSARVDIAQMYWKVPRLLEAVKTRLGLEEFWGVARMAGEDVIFGVPAAEVLAPLGDSVSVFVTPDGTAILFDNADPEAFGKVAERMKGEIGGGFASLAEGGVVVNYFTHSGRAVPMAPSYAILDEKRILVATHPQILKSVLRRGLKKGVLSGQSDFRRAARGLTGDPGVLLYFDAGPSHTRVYDALLPFSYALAAVPQQSDDMLFRLARIGAVVLLKAPLVPLDPGILPPGREVAYCRTAGDDGKETVRPTFFGATVALSNDTEGITLTAYGPLGLGSVLTHAVDHLVVSNPVTMGIMAATLNEYLSGDRPDDPVTPTRPGGAALPPPD